MVDESTDIQQTPPSTPKQVTFTSLMTRYALASLDKQLHLQELFGKERGWSFDLATSTLTFDEMPPYHIQLIGTESEQSKTWLWAWANTESNIPSLAMQSVQQLRAFGEKYAIKQFTAAEILVTDQDNGFNFCLIASGVLGADSFYRAAYDGGALYMLIQEPAYPRTAENILMRVSRVVPLALDKLNLPDARAACYYYLTWYGLDVKATETMLVATDHTGSVVRAEFGTNNQFVNISADII